MDWISDYDISVAIEKLDRAIQSRIQKHGNKPHHSPHESLGICQEELYEVMKCVHENQGKFVTAKEFRDLAVAQRCGLISVWRMEND